MATETCDVAIIGAGPAGAIASAQLARRGWDVRVYERQHFPRFSIGESLLPHCVEFLQQAGLFEAVDSRGFQFKDGAAFTMNGDYRDIYFPDKSTPGPGTVFQVRRDEFDQILIEGAQKAGARVSFGETVTAFRSDASGAALDIASEDGTSRTVEAKFVLDASGLGRVLPRLLDLELPSSQPRRRACFKHVRDRIDDAAFDRNKILIEVHPSDPRVWLWAIPLADGISSVGVVGADLTISSAGETPAERLEHFIETSSRLREVFRNAETIRPAGEISGFAANVKQLCGDRYALLGNAAEFLDPVFSSGVTIAMKSATLAVELIDRQLRGEPADWANDFAAKLQVGVDAFRACVNAWYDGVLQKLIFMEGRSEDVTRHFTAVLAGYAWDTKNPIVRNPNRFFAIMNDLTSG